MPIRQLIEENSHLILELMDQPFVFFSEQRHLLTDHVLSCKLKLSAKQWTDILFHQNPVIETWKINLSPLILNGQGIPLSYCTCIELMLFFNHSRPNDFRVI